jgi:hypothetical protein
MSKTKAGIVVAGDPCIDWLSASLPAADVDKGAKRPPNWRLQPGTHMVARPGGSLLLKRLLELAAGTTTIGQPAGKLEVIPPQELIHSLAGLDRFPYSSDPADRDNLVYRVARFEGFSGPASGFPHPVSVEGDDPDADVVVLDDAGNGFRDAENAWPKALRLGKQKPIVVYKMGRPLAHGKLWDLVCDEHMDRLVVVVGADHLRADGVNISRRLSWERTAKELIWQMASNRTLIPLAECGNVVVRFGIDGAVHYHGRSSAIEPSLYYDPQVAEDGFYDRCPGRMAGLTSAFVAALAAKVAESGLEAVGEGVRDGVRSSRRLLQRGFGLEIENLDYPGVEIFQPQTGEPHIADVRVPHPEAPGTADPKFWCILNELSGSRLEEVACRIVTHGEPRALGSVPVGQFGALRTVDRAETESFRSIRNVMVEYLAQSRHQRPLSVAVFGPPGSGKSFGITQVAESIAPGQVKTVEFNLAQFASLRDLTLALHDVRDVALTGKIPLAFFDEFDSERDGKLGWLRYFLAPMQDGKFRDGGSMHPIGRAIFVFAGGTTSTFAEFCCETIQDGAAEHARAVFRDAKGPDFVSRLRGYVNVMGPNPVNDDDPFFLVRRAMLLRSLLKRHAGDLIDGSGRLNIDESVLRAFLRIPRYKHGVRSMEAILQMSQLHGRKLFEQAALPPTEQLDQHLDGKLFARLVVRNVLFGSARELLAKAIHEKYRRGQKGRRNESDPAMLRWEDLSEDLKESNRQQADQIPEKLHAIGYGFAPAKGGNAVVEFTPGQVELLAEMEHDRFVAERLRAHWTRGPRDPEKKQSPHLVRWNELDEEIKQIDRAAMQAIPELMAEAGFEVYRLT